jgi:nicotinamidase-related amidase
MDFQPGILASIPDADPLLARTRAALSAARQAGVKAVYLRVAFTEQDYGAIPSHNKTFALIADAHALADSTPGAAIHRDLTPQPGDVTVTKTRFGAFSTTNLATYLNPRKIDCLILAGVSTSGAVLSTLRDAADRDYRNIVLADCCADPDPNVHRILVDHVFPHQADIVDSDLLKSLLI